MNVTQYNFSIIYSSSNGNGSVIERTNSTTITDLEAGTNYTISVTTIVSGDVKSEAVVINQFTIPSKPGAITVTSFTNSSISLSLGKPTGMNVTQCNFSIIYSSSNGNGSVIERTNSTTITDLEAGTNYTISVTTIVSGDVKSEAVVINQFTKPNPVTNVRVLNQNTTSVTLSWDRPIDHKLGYSYRVETRGDPPSDHIVVEDTITVAQLNPGTRYAFSVFTLAPDRTPADSVNVSHTTACQFSQ
uniref:receptor-type tyrosine-protein phosphatase eta-like n=1 Tax=Pristiophorus japonicus TaxID=55135 RepID=UPI00398EBC90